MEEKKFKMDEEWVDMPDGAGTFGALVAWVTEKLKGQERVLLGTLHGEAAVTQEEMAAWESRPIGEFDTLEFLSAEPLELARHTCGDMMDLMKKLEEGAERAAENFDAGEKVKAQEGFAQCAEGWGMVLQAYWSVIAMSDIDASGVEIDGRTLSSIVSEVKELFTRMIGDYGSGNWNEVKETLSEDLSLYIDPMREAFECLQEKLEEVAV